MTSQTTFSFDTSILKRARQKSLLGSALSTSLAWAVTAVFSPPNQTRPGIGTRAATHPDAVEYVYG